MSSFLSLECLFRIYSILLSSSDHAKATLKSDRFRDIPFEFSAIGKEMPGIRNHHQKSPSETSETSSSYKAKPTFKVKYVISHGVFS